jgi:primary-amine oxidase
MATNRLQSLAHHISATSPLPHPFDPLSNAEIEKAVEVIRAEKGQVHYNAITLYEPRKAEMLKWLENPQAVSRPKRIADVVVIAPGGKVYDGLVDLVEGKVLKWEHVDGVQPLVSLGSSHSSKGSMVTDKNPDHNGRSPNCGARCSKGP